MASVILVHGAWHDSWCWEHVAQELEGAGVDHHAVELPLTGHLDDVAATVATLDAVAGPKVVVGHSYGGLVISGATEGRDDVSHLIYLCAFLLDRGATVFDDLLDLEPTKLLDALGTTDDGRSRIDPAGAIPAFYAECPAPVAQAAVERLRPMDPNSTTHQCLGEPWRHIPTTYIVCERDEAISAEAQRRMATRASNVLVLDTDHSPFLSRTEETTSIILDAFESASA